MDTLQAIILGIIQGLTEFLPVSSSGHIELGKILLQTEIQDEALLFSAVVHAATALSTVVIYYKDIVKIIGDLVRFEWNESTQFVAMILVSMIPAGLVYVFLKEQLDQLFAGNILLVGCMLLVTGILLMLSSRIGQKQPAKVAASTDGNPVAIIDEAESRSLTFPKAFVTGIAQAIAILPGISRSGATISTALMQGVDRETAARFSFLMVIPVILGGTALELKDYFELQGTAEASTQAIGPVALIAGFLAAFISGLIACAWMIRIVKKSKLDYFAFYCFIVGTIAILAGLDVI